MSAKPPDITIRPARLDERGPLEDLQRRASLANEADRAALLAHPDAIELPNDHITSLSTLVAMEQGEPIGFSVVLPREVGQAELDGLFVEPSRWRIGLGRTLVAAASDLARQRGAQYLYVTGNPAALNFYHRCGFVIVGQTETRFAPAPVLRLTL